MKSVLISIKPKWCELIASGEKTIEVRKTRPKCETPFKCYIYETKGKSDIPTFISEEGYISYDYGRMKVIGEFVCDDIDKISQDPYSARINYYTFQNTLRDACLSERELNVYGRRDDLYCWHISDLVIYDEPKELSDFMTCKWLCDECNIADIRDSNSEYRHCIVDCGAKCVTRPPKSYMFVEELK